MTFPCETDLPPRRRRSAAWRAARQANFTDLTAFFKTLTGVPAPAVMIETFDITEGSLQERKAEADQIAQRIGAATEWCNGYYMATATVGGLPLEIHFNPPIFASDMTGGE
jgi:hypothetical protein